MKRRRDMAAPWQDELDLTAWEWVKLAAGTLIVFVVVFALLLLLSFAGPA